MTMRTAADHVQKLLMEAGFSTFKVGGFVRDTLLGREPKDVDVCTAATPDQVAALFPDNYDFVGAHFGVSLLKFGGATIEVATFRKDGQYDDNRRPDSVDLVTDVREDISRRDFTVCALLMDSNGEVVDYVDGRADLENKLIRCVGDPDRRFQEDALRLLRAVRFCASLDFTMEEETFAAVKRNAHLVKNVSVERVAVELEKMLTSGHADVAYDLLLDTGLATYVMPELNAFVGCEHRSTFHPEGDVSNHVRLLLRGLKKGCSVTLALGALLHDCAKPVVMKIGPEHNSFHGHEHVGEGMVREILTRLKFSNDVVDTVASHTKNHMKFFSARKMKRSTLMRFLRTPNFSELLELGRLDCGASCKDFTDVDFVENFLQENVEELNTPRLVNGNDLITMGYTPGPGFKVLLDAVETAQFERMITTREEALEFAKKRAGSVLGKVK